MSQVEIVALWAGLIASIAGIVLSIAALVFGWWVNDRATQVNDQTIKSLQKIESAVERLSDDTRSLIKAGWDKLLSNVGSSTEEEDDDASDRLASGLAEEARADIGLKSEAGEASTQTATQLERIEHALTNLEQSFAAQLKNLSAGAGRSRDVDRIIRKLQRLSPSARSLLSIISSSAHLERAQYQKLRTSDLAPSVRELRREGLLVPLSGNDADGNEVPVYWLPPGLSSRVIAAVQLLPDEDRTTAERVRNKLQEFGYTAG